MVKNFQSRWVAAGAAVALGVLTLLVYLPVRQHDFLNYDDNQYVTENAHIRTGLTWENVKWALHTPVAALWHPLTLVSHMADCQFYGLRPSDHHLTNVLLHAANTLLVFLVFRKMTGATGRSLVLAAFFGLHPLRVESVAWIAERKDVLSTFFFLLTLWAYAAYVKKSTVHSPQSTVAGQKSEVSGLKSKVEAARANEPLSPLISRGKRESASNRTVWYCLSLALFACGLMSKPMLVTLPFVLLLLDYWPLSRLSFPALQNSSTPPLHLFLEKLPFFLLSAAASLVTFLVQRSAGAVAATLPFAARTENALVSYCRYLGKLFWPVDLCILYPHPDYWPTMLVLLCGMMLLGISILAFAAARRHPWFLTGWLWYVGTLVPVIGLVQVGQQSMADRYSYIPDIGLLVAIIWGVHELTKRWRPAETRLAVTALVMTVLCVALTHRQIGYWKDSETVFRHAIAATKNNSLAHGSLAKALTGKGRIEEAIDEYRKAISLEPKDTIARNNLGILLEQKGLIDEAMSQYLDALGQNPNDAVTHNNLGMGLANKGQLNEATAHFETAIGISSGYADAHHNLGLVLAMRGHIDEAILQYQEAIRINPAYAKAYKNLGMALARKGRLDEAIFQFQQAVRIDPGYTEAQKYLALARAQKKTSAGPGRPTKEP